MSGRFWGKGGNRAGILLKAGPDQRSAASASRLTRNITAVYSALRQFAG
ncbi:Uncharacterised protein [Yersinia intermedia]|nr:Uncharacterised protein [Yersinia intermedia]CNB42926.1 Uncharacterised protein [Yersinia intermedia]CNF95220.1 Uncharacterised protein [Yersinia intermedia]CNH80924.1 Uncharacterised protein [Yersinia intermedia]CQJ53926.1 Uncharacterised protein [Yersinia intermedia]